MSHANKLSTKRHSPLSEKQHTRQVYINSNARSVESAHPNKRPESAAQDQKRENTSSRLVGLRDGIRLGHVVRLLTRIGVALGDTTSSVRHGWFSILNQQTRHRSQHTHLFSRTTRLVNRRINENSIAPVESTGSA